MCRLPGGPSALAAALAGQRALQAEDWGVSGPLRVRMALHTGPAEARDNDYFGAALSRVARLLATAHGGQVVLTQATGDAVQAHLPPGAELRDLGATSSDLRGSEHVYQLVVPDLPAQFPPLRTLAQTIGPADLTPDRARWRSRRR